jgi:hypothetical protein
MRRAVQLLGWIVKSTAPGGKRRGDSFVIAQDLDALQGQLLRPESPPQITYTRSLVLSDRMIAQQGGFTLCRQPACDHADAIESYLGEQEDTHIKLIIPGALKLDFLRRLRLMNITAHSLFPGIDGAGRSVSELLRLTRLSVMRAGVDPAYHAAYLDGL